MTEQSTGFMDSSELRAREISQGSHSPTLSVSECIDLNGRLSETELISLRHNWVITPL